MTLSARLRARARALRHAPDRLAHPLRRALARRRLRRRGPPGFVLFVCRGNICRSPFAEAVFRREVAGWAGQAEWARQARQARQAGWAASPPVVASAGFLAAGRAPPGEAVAAAGRWGIDLTGHRSTVLDAGLAGRAGLIVVTDAFQRRLLGFHFGTPARDVVVLGDLDPLPIRTRAIRDPFGRPVDVFEASYERIERCVRALVEEVAGGPGGVGGADGTDGAAGRRAGADAGADARVGAGGRGRAREGG